MMKRKVVIGEYFTIRIGKLGWIKVDKEKK